MIIGILQPGYLPWLGFFEQVARCDRFVYYDDVQFEKGGWRNRNRIKTAQGVQWLTVPVIGKYRGPQLITDLRINTTVDWQRKHVQSLFQNYRKAPFFEIYASELFALLEQRWTFLVDLDLELLAWLLRVLGISTPTLRSSELGLDGNATARLCKIIRHLDGDVFYEGAAGRNYLDGELLTASNIRVVYQDYAHPRYPQLYGGFMPYLSVVDLLFNVGPRSLDVIMGKVQ